MKVSKLINLIYSECIRIFKRPVIWCAILGISIIKLVSALSGPYVYTLIFDMGIREDSLLNLDYIWGKYTIISFVIYALAALPVISNYYEDYKSGRLKLVLSRASKTEYIIMRLFMVILIVSVCIIMGSVMYMILGQLLLGLPYVKETASPNNSQLFSQGHIFVFWLVSELRNCMEASFYAVISLGVSLFIKDSQFIIVLPAILRYFFMCFWNEYSITWLPKCMSPRAIYIYPDKLFISNEIMQCVYSVLFTVCIAVSIGWLMNIHLRKEL